MRRRALATLLVVAGAACGRNAAPVPCPGDVQVALPLAATLVEGAACAAAAGVAGAPALAATVTFTGEVGAALCPARALAEPLVGTRAGDRIDVSAPSAPASLAACGCALQVTERVTGGLTRDAAGSVVAFEGELVDEVTAAEGATCAPTGAAACPAPCRMRWALAGSR